MTNFAPGGGTGFRQNNNTWQTQTYFNESFGNLKPGAGLLLDVGAPRQLASITLNVPTSPLTLELRTTDNPGNNLDAYLPVGTAVTASGNVTLPAVNGGIHRYWLIWVSRLAPADGGYRATIVNPSANALDDPTTS